MNIKKYIWVLPFISFLLGYQAIRIFSKRETLLAPDVLGRNIQDAIKILSESKLNVRILAEKEDADLPVGVIVSQSPNPGKSVKSHQSIYLVVTKKPTNPLAPNYYGLTQEVATSDAKDKSIYLKTYSIPSESSTNTIIAQNALVDQELENKSMTIYLSQGPTQYRIFPNLKSRPVGEVIEFLKGNNIQVKVSHPTEINSDHNCFSCVVIDQRPMAGSLVDLKKPFLVELTAK